MWILLDILVLAVIGIYVYLSAKRGFVRTLVEFLGFFIAIYLSFAISGAAAEVIFDELIAPSVSESIEESIGQKAKDESGKVVDDVWESIPGIFTAGADKDALNSVVEEGIDNTDKSPLADTVTKSFVRPVAVALVKTVLGLILFGPLMFLIRFLAKLINKMFDIPVMGTLNKVLGGVAGALKGILIVYLAITVITLIMGLTSDGFLIFTDENVESSLIFRLFAENSPFGL